MHVRIETVAVLREGQNCVMWRITLPSESCNCKALQRNDSQKLISIHHAGGAMQRSKSSQTSLKLH